MFYLMHYIEPYDGSPRRSLVVNVYADEQGSMGRLNEIRNALEGDTIYDKRRSFKVDTGLALHTWSVEFVVNEPL